MAHKFEIIGQILVVTDTLTNKILVESPKHDIYYYAEELELDVPKIKLYDTSGANSSGGATAYYSPLSLVVDSSEVPFSVGTFKTFARTNLGFKTALQTETDPIFGASEAALFVSGDKAKLNSVTNKWGLQGNAGINPAVDFLGTTDAQPLIFKVNNLRSGYIHPSITNTFIGTNSGINETTGLRATALGFEALKNQNLSNNNTAIGHMAMTNTTTGGSSVAIGNAALFSNTTGWDNCAGGNGALFNNTTGVQNVGWGKGTLNNNLTGNLNTAVGHGALVANLASNNVGIGCNAGNSITTGTNNLALGSNAQVPSATLSNQISIANFFYRISTGESGVGTNAPTKTWDINGELRVRTLPTGLNTENILVVNGSGDVRAISPNSRFIDKQLPTGAINGTNTVFTLTNTPVAGSEHIYRNGLLQESGAGNDYTISGATITFATAPLTNDKIRATYRI